MQLVHFYYQQKWAIINSSWVKHCIAEMFQGSIQMNKKTDRSLRIKSSRMLLIGHTPSIFD